MTVSLGDMSPILGKAVVSIYAWLSRSKPHVHFQRSCGDLVYTVTLVPHALKPGMLAMPSKIGPQLVHLPPQVCVSTDEAPKPHYCTYLFAKW